MGYDPDRFDHVDEFWICHLCHQILKDPVLVCVSDHVLCRGCVSLATMCPWPNCEERVFEEGFRGDINMARFIDTFIICCDECEWRGPVVEEANHAIQCDARKVQCPNMNCTETIIAGTIAAHLETCPETLVPCANSPACTHASRRANVFQHGLRCEFNPCRWRASGCGFRGSASAIAAHEAYCTNLHEELAHLRATIKSLTAELEVHRASHTRDDSEEHTDSAAKESPKNRSRSKSISSTNPEISPRSSNNPLPPLECQDQARIEKEKRRENRRARREAAALLEATPAEDLVEDSRSEEKRARKEERRAIRKASREYSNTKALEGETSADEKRDAPGGKKTSLLTSMVNHLSSTSPANGKNGEAPHLKGKNSTSTPDVSVTKSAADIQNATTIVNGSTKPSLRSDADPGPSKNNSRVSTADKADDMEDETLSPVTVAMLANDDDADSIASSGGVPSSLKRKAPAKSKADSAQLEKRPSKPQNSETRPNISLSSGVSKKPSKTQEHVTIPLSVTRMTSDADSEPTTPVKKPSSMKKRDREEAGMDGNVKDPTAPKPKKVRIRLPSPFLQPDTDEEEIGEENMVGAGDEKGGRLEDWDLNADRGDEQDSDTASDGLGELVVTSVPVQARKLTEEGEVEESINVVPETIPTPASLLAKYHASKPVYMQVYSTHGDTQHLEGATRSFPGAIRSESFSQQYPDFPIAPLERHELEPHTVNGGESAYCYDSMSVSPVMRNVHAC